MGVQLDDRTLRSYLEGAVASGDPESHKQHCDDLVAYLFESEMIEVWGRRFANHYGRPGEYQEFIQVISEELIRYVRTINDDTLDAIDNVAKHLYFKAKTAVVRWLDSPATTVAQQMSGISRRYRQAMVARSEYMAKFHRDPSNRELVEYINSKMLATRKDAAKQGALVTEADVTGQMLHPYSMDLQPEDGEGDGFGAPTQDDTVRNRGELAMTVRRLAQIAEQMFGDVAAPTVTEVLTVWMDFVLDNEPPTVTAIAARFGIDRPHARERMRQVDEVLATLRGDGALTA